MSTTQTFKCTNPSCSTNYFSKTHSASVMWTTCPDCGGRCYPA